MPADRVRLCAESLVVERSTRGSRSFLLGPVRLELEGGRILAVVGPSGCGKSTLLGALSGELVPRQGRVRLEIGDESHSIAAPGQRVGGRSWRQTRRHLGFVYQDPSASLNPLKPVGVIVGESLVIHRLGSRRDVRRRVLECLREVGLSPDMVDRLPSELSGGQRQRVAIARAIAHDPAVIFMDEPTSSLDPSVQAGILGLIARLRQPGRSLLFVTHDLAVVDALADDVLDLEGGPGEIRA